MQRRRRDVQDAPFTINSRAARVFSHKSQGGSLAQVAQLAPGLALSTVRGVKENAAIQEGAVKIRHKRSDVSGRTGNAIRTLRMLEVVDGGASRRVPMLPVALVDRIDGTGFRNANVGMGKQKFPDARIKGEAMHALPRSVHKHGRSAVQKITRGYLLTPRLKDFIRFYLALCARPAPQNGKNGPDIVIDVNI